MRNHLFDYQSLESVSYLSKHKFPITCELLQNQYLIEDEACDSEFIDWVKHAPQELIDYLDSDACRKVWLYFLKHTHGFHDYIATLDVSPFRQYYSQLLYRQVSSDDDTAVLIEAAQQGSLKALEYACVKLVTSIARHELSLIELEAYVDLFERSADRFLGVGHFFAAQICEAFFKFYKLDYERAKQVLDNILFHYKLADKLMPYSEIYMKICFSYNYLDACQKNLLFYHPSIKTIQHKLADLFREINNQPHKSHMSYAPNWLSLETRVSEQFARLLAHQSQFFLSCNSSDYDDDYYYDEKKFLKQLTEKFSVTCDSARYCL